MYTVYDIKITKPKNFMYKLFKKYIIQSILYKVSNLMTQHLCLCPIHKKYKMNKTIEIHVHVHVNYSETSLK